jgi:hypothetical protein
MMERSGRRHEAPSSSIGRRPIVLSLLGCCAYGFVQVQARAENTSFRMFAFDATLRARELSGAIRQTVDPSVDQRHPNIFTEAFSFRFGIELRRPSRRTRAIARLETDSDGRFSLGYVAPGSYRLIISAEPWRTQFRGTLTMQHPGSEIDRLLLIEPICHQSAAPSSKEKLDCLIRVDVGTPR